MCITSKIKKRRAETVVACMALVRTWGWVKILKKVQHFYSTHTGEDGVFERVGMMTQRKTTVYISTGSKVVSVPRGTAALLLFVTRCPRMWTSFLAAASSRDPLPKFCKGV